MTSTATNNAPSRGEVLLDVQDLAVEFDTEAGRATFPARKPNVLFSLHAQPWAPNPPRNNDPLSPQLGD